MGHRCECEIVLPVSGRKGEDPMFDPTEEAHDYRRKGLSLGQCLDSLNCEAISNRDFVVTPEAVREVLAVFDPDSVRNLQKEVTGDLATIAQRRGGVMEWDLQSDGSMTWEDNKHLAGIVPLGPEEYSARIRARDPDDTLRLECCVETQEMAQRVVEVWMKYLGVML